MISVVIATCGSRDWHDLAWSRAYPSVQHAQPVCEIIVEHLDGDATVEQARNYGASRASRPWLVFLDADDVLAVDFLWRMTDAIARRGATDPFVLYAPALSQVRDGSASAPAIPNTHMSMPPLNHCVIGTAVSAAVFEDVGGFREGYRPWEDYELWLRCLRCGCTIEYVEDAIYVQHVMSGSRSDIPRRDAVRLASRIHREHRQALRG